jgi:hypothetical protein
MLQSNLANSASIESLRAMLCDSIECISHGVMTRTLSPSEMSDLFMEVRSALLVLFNEAGGFTDGNMMELCGIHMISSGVLDQFDDKVSAGLMMGMDISTMMLVMRGFDADMMHDTHSSYRISPVCMEMDFAGEFDVGFDGPWFSDVETIYSPNWVTWYRSWATSRNQ